MEDGLKMLSSKFDDNWAKVVALRYDFLKRKRERIPRNKTPKQE